MALSIKSTSAEEVPSTLDDYINMIDSLYSHKRENSIRKAAMIIAAPKRQLRAAKQKYTIAVVLNNDNLTTVSTTLDIF